MMSAVVERPPVEPTNRMRPIHPGEILLEDFLKPWGMTAYRLAQGLGVDPPRVAQILKGERAVTADTALRLSRFLGTTPDFWLNLQAAYDLKITRERLGAELARIEPFRAAAGAGATPDGSSGASGTQVRPSCV